VIGEKGKIPRAEWPKILALYGGGATIAEIGRRYGCTAPAIRYIIKRNGTLKRHATGEPLPAGPGGKRNAKSADSLAPARAAEARSLAPPAGRPRGDILGPDLRGRLSRTIASFLVSLDQAIVTGSPKSLMDLVEASDLLMRSIARTRIEIERRLAAGIAPDAADDTVDNATMGMPQQNG
jgi:hypothetical protein